MNISFILAFFFCILSPSEYGVAINSVTKECGYFQGGDEYGSYVLPSPWEINYYGTPIQNETGTHLWDGNIDSIESFCKELGFTYIPGNLATMYGKNKLTSYSILIIVFIALIIVLLFSLVLLIIWFVKRITKKNTTPVS